MPHVRKSLRDTVKTALVSGVTLAGGRVSGAKQYGLSRETFPFLTVSTPAVSANRIGNTTSGGGVVQMDIALEVVAYIKSNADTEDAADAIAEQAEATIAALEGTAPYDYSIQELSSSFDPGEGAEARPATLTMTWTLRLYARLGAQSAT